MNILCREGEELKPFYGENNYIYKVVSSFAINWSFSNIDLEVGKTHSRVHNAEEKDEYNSDWVRSLK